MPKLPTAKPRPWQIKRKTTQPQQGRKIHNPFYQTMPWRNFRKQCKAEAIEQWEKVMRDLIEAGRHPLPPVFNEPTPLCAECLRGNTMLGVRYRKANTLDHKKPINPKDAYDTKGGMFGEPLNKNNVEFLCTQHHAKKSGAEHSFHKGRG